MDVTAPPAPPFPTPAPDPVGPRIVCTPGACGGQPRLAGRRITVKHIVLDHQRRGLSPDEIASSYTSLTLADVYAALGYYHENRERIDADIRFDDDHWEAVTTQAGSLADQIRRRAGDAPDAALPPG